MELFDRPDFKEGLIIFQKYFNIDKLKKNISQISEIEFSIGTSDMWENIFTYRELNILESNNFSYKNNNLIYTIH